MTKAFQALLTGMFFTFLLDFLLFLGVFINYIKPLEIELFYNVLFADNQSILAFLSLSIFMGYLVIYNTKTKITLSIILSLFVLVSSCLIPPLGYKLGEIMFMKKNITLKDKRHTFIGDIYYNDRKHLVFYDKELKKTILLQKDNLK